MQSFVDTSDYSGHSLGDISSDSKTLRISALKKALRISDSIDGVTIGPNSICRKESWCENIENEQNNCNLNESRKDPICAIIDQYPTPRKEITFSREKLRLEEELERREKVSKVVNKRKEDMMSSVRSLQIGAAMMNEILARPKQQEEHPIFKELQADEERRDQLSEIKRRNQQQLNAQRLQERNERFKREAEQHLMREREGILNRIRNNFRERCIEIGMLSKACKDRMSVSQMLGPHTIRLKELDQQMEVLNEKARRGELSHADVQFAEQLAQQGEDVLIDFASEVARIELAYQEEVARREHEMRLAEARTQIANAQMQQPVTQDHTVPEQMQHVNQTGLEIIRPVERLPETPPNEVAPHAIETGATTTDSSSVETVIDEYDQEAYQIYQKAKDLLAQYTASPAFIEFRKATEIKKFRFECQKAINQPLNTIAVVNGSHLTEKYNKLHQLLSGQSSLNVYQHPQGPIYCKNLLAEKIVNQGETLVSSKPESAFGIAAVTVALMSDFPDFAELLKAHFYMTCPYLVPFFPPRLQGQTDESYYETLGYKYTDGVVEKETKFLTRMSGVMRLYAAIIVANRRRNVTTAPPLGLQDAWRWLAATINYEVQPKFADICATLILDMLEVVGNALWTVYPRQCPKLLILLRQHYYPLIENCGGVGGGPATRLGTFLNDCIARNFIHPPNGQLPPNFW